MRDSVACHFDKYEIDTWQGCSQPIQKQYIESVDMKVTMTSKVALNLSEKRLIYTEIKENIKMGNILQFLNVVTCNLFYIVCIFSLA